MPRIPHSSPQTLRVFEALLGAPAAWRYGYDLSRETRLQPGTLYPILIRLAQQHILETRWEPSETAGRPPRHLYRLTADGAVLAGDRLAARAARTADTGKAHPKPGTATAGRGVTAQPPIASRPTWTLGDAS